MALITFMVSHPSGVDALPLKRKELQELNPCLLVLFGGDFFPLLVTLFSCRALLCSSLSSLHLVCSSNLISKTPNLKKLIFRSSTYSPLPSSHYLIHFNWYQSLVSFWS
jgi:hypothetical protein